MMNPSGVVCFMRTVPGYPHHRALTQPLPCKNFDGTDGFVPVDFAWDGSSSGLFAPLFPRWNHPIASCRHDWRCLHAKNKAERKWADQEFKKDVERTSWKITSWLGYAGVRVGAFMGIGVSY